MIFSTLFSFFIVYICAKFADHLTNRGAKLIINKEDTMQRSFLERIREKQEQGTTLAQVLSDVLSVSLDSAYRRIRGEIPLTFTEITKLCELYSISFDNLLAPNTQGHPGLRYKRISRETFERDVFGLWRDIERLYMHDDIKMHVLLTGVPLDRLAQRPTLLKLFYNMWLGIRTGYDFTYSKKEVPAEIKDLASVVYGRVAKAPSVYILSPTWLVNFLSDLSFFRRVGRITDRETDLLREEMLGLLNEMEIEAKTGMRSNGTEIEFLLSQISFDGINSLIETKGKMYSLTVLHEVSFIFSENTSSGIEHKSWIDHIKNLSICITQSGALERKLFFEKHRGIIENSII